MKFSVDDTISMIPRKNIVGTTVPAVDDCYEVKWSNREVLMATVLAAGKYVQVVIILCVCTCTCTDATIHVHIIQVIYHQCGRKKRRLCANI